MNDLTLPPNGHGLAAAIERWARSPELATLVRETGGEVPREAGLGQLLEWLDRFSERWDYRGGAERPAEHDGTVDEPDVPRAAFAALGQLGVHPPQPGAYDHLLVLGGLAGGCLARAQYAARLLGAGDVTAGQVTALGGFRQTSGSERSLGEEMLGLDAVDEFDVVDAAVRWAFGLANPQRERGERSERVGASWWVREYAGAGGLPIVVCAASSSEPGKRRANTPDTYAWFARTLARLRRGQRILIVTTQVYVPYQHAEALRLLALPFGVDVSAVGFDPDQVDPRLRRPFTAWFHLQETRSAIQSMRRLLASLQQ